MARDNGEKFLIKFIISEKDGEVFKYFKNVPKRYRAYEAKKMITDLFKGSLPTRALRDSTPSLPDPVRGATGNDGFSTDF
ncbi:MAG: hypothetical protein A2X93_04915 [Deltaproteobacteria bacterium GWC2_56_8]|nr:MAG: hypothetical protein A2X93_04915 [Deltaproteobacteria bacterium GWC2_56_8]